MHQFFENHQVVEAESSAISKVVSNCLKSVVSSSIDIETSQVSSQLNSEIYNDVIESDQNTVPVMHTVASHGKLLH